MKEYTNKYEFSRKENVYYAKRYIKESIFNSVKFEGYQITFPQTETIINGVSVGGLSMLEIDGVINLRDGWRFILETLDESITTNYLLKLHNLTGRNEALKWGVLRNGKVGLSGTKYIPKIPTNEDIYSKLNQINKLKSKTSIAIYTYLYMVKAQLFWDVNKRTSMLIMNKILIENGCGWCTIAINDFEEFNIKLTNYFNSKDNEYAGLDDFLYKKCIRGNL